MQEQKMAPTATGPVDSYLVMMLGAAGVGKAALSSQFRTSECINAYEGPGEEINQMIYDLDERRSFIQLVCNKT